MTQLRMLTPMQRQLAHQRAAQRHTSEAEERIRLMCELAGLNPDEHTKAAIRARLDNLDSYLPNRPGFTLTQDRQTLGAYYDTVIEALDNL